MLCPTYKKVIQVDYKNTNYSLQCLILPYGNVISNDFRSEFRKKEILHICKHLRQLLPTKQIQSKKNINSATSTSTENSIFPTNNKGREFLYPRPTSNSSFTTGIESCDLSPPPLR